MSKPLYMQFDDLRREYNLLLDRHKLLKEELAELRQAFQIGHEALMAMQARAERAESEASA